MRRRHQPVSIAAVHFGFTLVELLVAIAILILLTTMSVAVYSTTASHDRIRSSARQVQSAFGGARDRAIRAAKDDPQSRRGIRLLVDASNGTTVTSMVYVGTDSTWTDGQVMVGRQDADGDKAADDAIVRTIRAWPKQVNGNFITPGWKNLYDQGLLVDGSRIRIPAGNGGNWYSVYTYSLANYSGNGPEILVLTSDYRGNTDVSYPLVGGYTKGGDGEYGTAIDDDQNQVNGNPEEAGAPNSDDQTDINALSTPQSYELELKPSVLPNQEPLRLSGGIAIDLAFSKIPPSWYQVRSLPKGSAAPPTNQGWGWNPVAKTNTYFYNGWGAWWNKGTDSSNGANDIWLQYSPRMDIMFAPSGAVTGALATRGTLHLRLAETQDIAQRRDPADLQAAPMLYCTLFTQTGYLATFNVNPTDVAPQDGIADDPLYFARTGGTAGR